MDLQLRAELHLGSAGAECGAGLPHERIRHAPAQSAASTAFGHGLIEWEALDVVGEVDDDPRTAKTRLVVQNDL